MRIPALVLALAVLASSAQAAAPAHWTADPAASRLGFQGKMNGEVFSGAFKRWSAAIVFDPANLAASKAAVDIDMTSAGAGDPDRDEALPTADWFAAQRFPHATFTTGSIKSLGGGRYQATGDLAIRGVHKAVVLPFTLVISGDTARMTGALTLNRTAFGIGQGRWSTADVVDTNVTVNVALTAHRAH